jgi:hypothetical protein
MNSQHVCQPGDATATLCSPLQGACAARLIRRVLSDAPKERQPLQDRYVIINILGDGRHGTTYLAKARHAPRTLVAVKLLKRSQLSAERSASLQAYVARMATIVHPAVVQVRDAGVDEGGRGYVVTDFIVGRKILDYCARSGMTAVERQRLFTQVIAAVDAAHQQGVVHGHVVPDNILVTTAFGNAVATVMDFAHGMLAGRRQGRPAADVRGLTALLMQLLQGTEASMRRRERR